MDGMFYSLEQTAKKLNKTEEEVNAIVKEGRLRIFFDGPNQLFKVDEVESLLAATSVRTSEPETSDEPVEAEEEEIALADSEDTMALFESSDEQEPVIEDIGDVIGLADEEDDTEVVDITEMSADTSADTTEVGDVAEAVNEDDFLMLSEDKEESQEEPAVEETVSDSDFVEDETFADLSETLGLSERTGETSALTSADDTTLDGGGVNILGETDGGYELAGDTMGETKSASDFDGESLEDIEDDVNLDSFGSGSGLLDLSLQADDTSLGGILDDIYSSDEEGGDVAADTEGSAMAVTAEAEEMFAEGDISIGEPKAFAGAGMIQGYEVAPDASSNMLGAILVLPFIAVIYTTVVVLAGMKGFKPSILNAIEGYISYIFIGFIGVAIVVGLIACFSGGGDGTKKAKVKKEKKPKAKKEKKPKAKKVKKAKK